MEFNWITIGILVAVWLVGYLLGLLEAAIKNSGDKPKEETSPASSPELEGDENIPEAPEVIEPEVLAIFERLSGALKLRLDGQLIEYPDDTNEEERQKLLGLIRKLRPWVEAKEEKPNPLTADEKITASPTISPLTTENKVNEAHKELTFQKMSMREQVDSILQKKLEDHPLESRGIRLGTSESGGLLFQIGLDEYEWLEDIPDLPVQEIIRKAIAEWEERVAR